MIEFIAALFTIASVILTIKANKLCWPVGIVGIIFYMIIFYQHSLWSNFYLQFIFIIQSILGIINWNKSEKKLPITWVKNKINIVIMILLIYPLFFYISKNGSMPHLDSITTFSVIATGLLIYKKIDAWIFWLLVDIISVFMFYKSGLYLSMGIYVIFTITAIIGLKEWSMSKKQIL